MSLLSKFTILGSGASSGVPWLACTLAPRGGDAAGPPLLSSCGCGDAAEVVSGVPSFCCPVCADADNPLSPNKRGNVSCVARIARPDGGPGLFNVVVDCGKTFRDTVVRVWPRLSPPLRRIDALLLTHAHADAIFGLDCLREVAPDAPVHVYCHAPTMAKLKAIYGYLMPTEQSGGAPPVTYVADLVFHVITPWEPFELEGSGGVLVTPIPVEHAGRFGSPEYNADDSCLAFEFGAVRAADTVAPAAVALRADARGLPTLPPWDASDRVVWLSDVRALSAEARAYFAARATTLLCVDALGLREYPTHFGFGQALAAAADLMGPGSATAARAGGGDAARVRLVGINHEVDHGSEQAVLETWARRARVRVRPADASRDPVTWACGVDDAAVTAAEESATSPLSLDVAIAHDGATDHLRLNAPYASAAALGAEVEAVRAAARALAASDATDYSAVQCDRENAARARRGGGAGAWDAAAPTAREFDATEDARDAPPSMRWREDYLASRPNCFRRYTESASEGVRKGWTSGRRDRNGNK